MREEHLDLLPLTPGGQVGVGLGDVAGEVARAFVDGARDLSSWLLRAASRLQRTGRAVVLSRAVAELVIAADRAELHQLLHE